MNTFPNYPKIIGVGSCLADAVLTNEELSKTVNTSDEWIRARTGITQRYINKNMDPDKAVVHLATESSKKAFERAGISADEIDVIIVATCTPGQNFPSVACRVQKELSIGDNCQSFDVSAACGGFILGLHIAKGLFASDPELSKALIIGSEVLSSILDWNDRSTCVLFGDGAGAVVLDRGNENAIFDTYFRSDGRYSDLLFSDPQSNVIKMDGAKVFTKAVVEMTSVSQKLLSKNNLSTKDISLVIPHQANNRIIDAIVKRLQLQDNQILSTIDAHANTSAASIPLALDTAFSKNLLQKNDYILLTAFGGGFTWGGALLTW